jgi:hypothetical protein
MIECLIAMQTALATAFAFWKAEFEHEVLVGVLIDHDALA